MVLLASALFLPYKTIGKTILTSCAASAVSVKIVIKSKEGQGKALSRGSSPYLKKMPSNLNKLETMCLNNRGVLAAVLIFSSMGSMYWSDWNVG